MAQVQPRIKCGLCDLIGHRVNQCKELKHLANSFRIVSSLPQKLLSNQEKITRTYCRICSHFHHTIKCEHLPKLRVARVALSLHSQKELDLPKKKTWKWQQRNLSPTPDHFRVFGLGMSNSFGECRIKAALATISFGRCSHFILWWKCEQIRQ